MITTVKSHNGATDTSQYAGANTRDLSDRKNREEAWSRQLCP